MLRAALIKAGDSRFLNRQVTTNPLARRVVRRFIAGETLDDAVEAARALNAAGTSVALNLLGEHTLVEGQARQATAAYLTALERIHAENLDANVSVKLTAMGLNLSGELAAEEAAHVCDRAKETGAMVGVDMESFQQLERTLAVVDQLRRRVDSAGLGVCLQAYLYRTGEDLERLNGWDVPVRLVKGAYAEPPEVAHPRKPQVDQAYAELLVPLLADNPYPMIATHDPALIALAKQIAGRVGRARDDFEFQMIYGIRRDLQRQVVAEGYRLRTYVPYGDQWYPYFARRLAERPANLTFFLSSLVRR
jgi:proline dehydrogenase